MKHLYIFILAMLISLPLQVNADESVLESAQDLGKDVSREASQKMNRLDEATCMKSETECLKEKAENRMQESGDAVSDKYDEIKNVVD